ncbi:DUF1554 domain-containing protein [Leptospira sp. 201903071]|uniref:DUF1554 domain-containing protein n=1 Tax=Leptospira ainazelensis TaxID=2810034 RepID=UPI001964759F|nr:DUF1554 domain-containing protein [Leptospira ainazelensis]MBM9500939.1 DUF1554 domain-containing protein [Leptospira ainazelensis]
MRNSVGFCFLGIFCGLLFCSKAEKVEMDLSKGGVGMFVNILPVIFPVSENPFDLTILPQSLNEGQSVSITLTLKTKKENEEEYRFVWAETAGNPVVSPASFIYKSGVNSTNLTVNPIDNDCLEDTMTLNATRVSDSKVFALSFKIIDMDKCIFLASNSTVPGVSGPGFTGNLGGIAGADAKCQAEKPTELPGNASEYKALLGITGVRNPTQAPSTAANDWPLKIGVRYFSYSASAPEGALIGTGVSNGIGSGSGVFSFPLESSIDHSSDPSMLNFWTGLGSSFDPVGGTYDCASYTNGTTGFGYDGLRGATSASAISSYYYDCSNLARLICVRQ